MYVFRWNRWNIEHVAEHGIDPIEAEFVVDNVDPPWPEYIGNGKWRTWGRTRNGDYLQVIYVFDPDDVVFVIHAMPLTERQKRQYRRRIR